MMIFNSFYDNGKFICAIMPGSQSVWTIELGQPISNDAARGLTVMRYDIDNDLSFFLPYDD